MSFDLPGNLPNILINDQQLPDPQAAPLSDSSSSSDDEMGTMCVKKISQAETDVATQALQKIKFKRTIPVRLRVKCVRRNRIPSAYRRASQIYSPDVLEEEKKLQRTPSGKRFWKEVVIESHDIPPAPAHLLIQDPNDPSDHGDGPNDDGTISVHAGEQVSKFNLDHSPASPLAATSVPSPEATPLKPTKGWLRQVASSIVNFVKRIFERIAQFFKKVASTVSGLFSRLFANNKNKNPEPKPAHPVVTP